jgi:hypothetical protein
LKNGELIVNNAKFFINTSPSAVLPDFSIPRKKYCSRNTAMFEINKYFITGGNILNPPIPLLKLFNVLSV